MENINFYELAGNLAYIIFMGSFVFKDIMWLRISTILGCFIILFYDYNISETPLWTLIIWNCLCMIINLIQLLILFRERCDINLSKHEKEIYVFFSIMMPSEFKKLLKIAYLKKIPAKLNILEETQQVDKLIFIIRGQVAVLKCGKQVAISDDGHFIGEIAFITEEVASETIIAIDEIEVLEWEFSDLRKLFMENREIENSFLAILAKNMCNKLGTLHFSVNSLTKNYQ